MGDPTVCKNLRLFNSLGSSRIFQSEDNYEQFSKWSLWIQEFLINVSEWIFLGAGNAV